MGDLIGNIFGILFENCVHSHIVATLYEWGCDGGGKML